MATDYRSKVVNSALKDVGVIGGKATGDDVYINYYNKIAGTTFSVRTTPWCAIFVTYKYRTNGIPTSICPNFAGCTTFRDTFLIPKGLWRPRGTYTPKPADPILFDWNQSGNCDHVGLVERVVGDKVYTVEGNSKDGVRHKSYALTSKYIAGYGAINFEAIDGNMAVVNNVAAVTNNNFVANIANKSSYVKRFQTWMNVNYSMGLEVDGSYGPRSKQASIRTLQTILRNHYKKPIVITGRYDITTRNNVYVIVKGNQGHLVRLAQGILYAKGYNPNGFDGSFGAGMDAAVRKYQHDKNLKEDGLIGPETWGSLCN